MSLILEALKKSEAERRRGQSPDLFGNTLGTPPPRRELPRVWPLLLLGLILLASAWMIWSGGSRGEAVPAPESPAPIPAAPDEQAVEAAPVLLPTVPTAPVQQAPVAAPTKAEPKPIAKSTQPEAPSVPVSNAPVAMAEPEASAPAEESLPTLAVLDASSRAALPPLKLSMHVYAEEPGKRFAIVDGQRISEGALLGPGVVEAIRRDGVVININGRRLLLPKP